MTSQRVVNIVWRVLLAALLLAGFALFFLNDLLLKSFLALVQESAKPISDIERRTALTLFIGIFSSPPYLDRRNAVRQTWGSQCKITKDVVCWFVTDGQDVEGRPLEGKVKSSLHNESRSFNDMLFAQSPGGMNFARRYLWLIQWASERYKFKYLLRVDDDYFICFKKLMLELRRRPKRKLSWGWLRCSPGLVTIDEGFIIVTSDIIQSFLSRANTTLLCHPSGTQALAIWLRNISGLRMFGDNKRIFQSLKDFEKTERRKNEMCRKVLAVHQSYPDTMKSFWRTYVREGKRSYAVPKIVFPCNLPPVYDYRASRGKWFAVPKLCRDLPVWNRGKYFKGRED